MLARISGEVGTLCIVLLRVYSGTCLPNFIEIGSYLTNREQKISQRVFFETGGNLFSSKVVFVNEENTDTNRPSSAVSDHVTVDF